MDNKLQELTDTLFREGVEKGEARAAEIVAAAEKKAAHLVAEAEENAAKIVAEAKKAAAQHTLATEADLKLAGAQALSSVKQRIAGCIHEKLIRATCTRLFTDPAALKEIVLAVISRWRSSDRLVLLGVLLPDALKEQLEHEFAASVNELFKDGVTIAFSDTLTGGFRIGPQGGTYAVTFTDEHFAEFFGQYLRPVAKSLVFGG